MKMRRTRPAFRLERSPLVQVLAQVAFSSPVYAVRNYLPEIHDRFRALDLGETQESTEQEIAIGGSTGAHVPVPRSRWDFFRRDRQWGVVLTEQLLVLHTTSYGTFDNFMNMFGEVTRTILGSAKIERLQRIGLRYVDQVRKQPDEQFEDYVIPQMLGFPRACEDTLGARRMFARSDTLLQTSVGALAIRCSEGQGLTLPPDLLPTPLRLRQSAPPEEMVLLLDLDHFRVGEMESSSASLQEAFWDLHDPLDLAFRTVVTDHAWATWGKVDLT
jgi:uncharacterized protein (TIGR04255 family)